MRLIVNVTGEIPRTVDVAEEEFTVGRSPKNALQIESESISRSHIKLRSSNATIYVTDLGSVNGTYINNERLKPNVEVPWNIFMPIILGEKVSVAFEPAPLELLIIPEKKVKRTINKTKKKTTNVEKVATTPGIKPHFILLVMIIGLTYFVFDYYNRQENRSQPQKKSNQTKP